MSQELTMRADHDAYRLLVQEVKDYAIFMLDPRGTILTWNAGARRLNGYAAEEAIGQNFSIFYSQDDIASRKPQRELELASTDGRVEDEGWRLRKDGSRFWANVVITALHDDNGNLRGFAKVTRDMTESRSEEALKRQAQQLERRMFERTTELSRLNSELQEANRMKDEFIATLSHELRTPLTSIGGWVQMLRAGQLNETQRAKAFEVIERNLGAQTKLIDDLLNVSRIVAGKLKIDLQPAYPTPLIQVAIDSIRPTMEAKEIRFTSDLDPALGPIRLDPTRLHQVVWNLLTNAVKFTPRSGHIHVNLKRINNHALLQVSDSGEGIDPEFLPFVFDRFSQADSSRSRKQGGLGVGLAIVKHIVEMHGGTVYAESAGPGKGSTFNVTFPIPAIAAQPIPSKEEAVRREPSLQGARILVVEDEEDTREMITQALEQREGKVIPASSAEEALQLFEQNSCDLLISDIGMSAVDGYEFIQRVRLMHADLRDVPAIALTAYASEEDRRISREAGFNAHLSKPIALAELIRTASRLIAEHE